MSIQRIREFKGVHAGPPGEQLSESYSPEAYNTALELGGSAWGLRPGWRTSATYAFGDVPIEFTGVYSWVSTHNGTDYANNIYTTDYGVYQAYGQSITGLWGLLTDCVSVRWAVACNRLYGVTDKGDTFKVYRQSGNLSVGVCEYVGLLTPAQAPILNSNLPTISSELSGTVDFAFTYYNSETGAESSRSPLLTVDIPVGNQVSIRFPFEDNDRRYRATHVNLYIRQQSTQTRLYRDTTLQFPVPTVMNQNTVYWMIYTQAALNAMVTPCPDEHENDPPPEGLIDFCWFQSRMFATDGDQIYYSHLGQPEQWDPEFYELVNPQDGQKIVGFVPVGENTLGILKERSIYLLSGDSPQTWEIKLLTDAVGAVHADAVTSVDGSIFGWGHLGPWRWDREGVPVLIAEEVAIPRSKDVTLWLWDDCKAIGDPEHHRVLFAPRVADRWTVLPYYVTDGKWDALGWDLDAVNAWTYGQLSVNGRGVIGVDSLGRVRELDWAQSPGTQRTVVSGSGTTVELTAGSGASSGTVAFIDPTTLEVTYRTYTLSGTTLTLGTALASPLTSSTICILEPIVAEWKTKILEGQGLDGGPIPEVKKRYIWVGSRPEGLTGLMKIDINGTRARTWTLGDRRRVAATGTNCQVKVVGWTRGLLHELHVRYEPRHDRR